MKDIMIEFITDQIYNSWNVIDSRVKDVEIKAMQDPQGPKIGADLLCPTQEKIPRN